MSIDAPRKIPTVGTQVRRWRTERGLTLAGVADRTGLNIGYLSQIENGKAVPSIGCLTTLSNAFDVPIAWFFIDDTPAPVVVRRADRPVTTSDSLRLEKVDGGGTRDLTIVEVSLPPGGHPGLHAHVGDEHHIVLRGRFRMTQGEHVVEVGPGDYVRWDGTIPHDAEVISEDEGALLIVSRRHP
ncbi:MAG: helix-turn-helix domain-containing protein [Chloroflexota bacterium]